MSKWQKVALADIYDISSGLSKSADSFGSGYPFLSFKEVFANYFLPDELDQLVESSEKERERCSIKRGDVFLTRTSETMHELGMSSVALKDYPAATFNGFTKRLRPKADSQYKVHPEFIGYCLRSPSFRTSMLAFSTMSTRASLNNDMISRLVIQLPPIDIQKHIAKVLKALDDKIKVNRQANQNLEDIALAIFRSWFIDFEPTLAKIIAKQAGKDPQKSAMAAISGISLDDLHQLSQEQQDQLSTIAELFPDSLVDSELGEIPKGWKIKQLNEFVRFQNGYAFKSKDWKEEGIPVVKIGSVKPGLVELNNCSYVTPDTVADLARFKLNPGDLLVGMSGYPGETGLVPISDSAPYLNQRVGKVLPKDELKYGWLYCVLRNSSFKSYAESRAHGSAQANVSGKALMEFPVIFASEKLLEFLHIAVSPLISKYLNGAYESERLELIRNHLLARLLTGKLKTVTD